jgi:hypothetical protein
VRGNFESGQKRLNPIELLSPTKLNQVARLRRAPEDHMEHGNAIIQEDPRTAVCEVAEMLDIKLKPAIATTEEYSWRKLLSCNTKLLIPNVAAATRQTNRKLKFEVLPHLPYLATFMPAAQLKRH